MKRIKAELYLNEETSIRQEIWDVYCNHVAFKVWRATWSSVDAVHGPIKRFTWDTIYEGTNERRSVFSVLPT